MKVKINNLNKTELIYLKNKLSNSSKYYNLLEVAQEDVECAGNTIRFFDDLNTSSNNPLFYLLIKKNFGMESKLYIPESLRDYVINGLNDFSARSIYLDKNMYGILMRTDKKVVNVLSKIGNEYFDGLLRPVENIYHLIDNNVDYIIKPSRGDNGANITLFSKEGNLATTSSGEKMNLLSLIDSYGRDFCIQKKIIQHECVAKPHPGSVNTLRLVTLRWKNQIHYILGYLRIGVAGAVNDNGATGGISVGINDDGISRDFAVDKDLNIYKSHPTTGFLFSEGAITIAEFQKFKDFVCDLHLDIPHHNLVSWDIAVDQNGEPVFIEHNFRGPIWVYQAATGRPLLGEFTSDILRYIAEHGPRSEPLRGEEMFSAIVRKRISRKIKRSRLAKLFVK